MRDALQTGDGRISYQVIQEFFNAAAKPGKHAMTAIDKAAFLMQVLEPLLAVQSSVPLFASALKYRDRWMLSWYDSLILAAALEAGCSILYSEDFQHGQRFDDLRIVNPFL